MISGTMDLLCKGVGLKQIPCAMRQEREAIMRDHLLKV